jgi:hypothetical protein|tara:strand:+ start:115 stop:363 length:249 start_codon:yes stop_codon:yes gene_type:complete
MKQRNFENMIEKELEQWVSEFHPTVEKEIIEVLRARVQYAILDELNYMVSNQIGTPDEVKKIVLEEITEITKESIELDDDVL